VLTALWSRSPSSPRSSPRKPLVALPSAFATHARSARSQLAMSFSTPAARLSRRLPPWPRMHARSADSQLAAPPSVLVAHARLVALHASHARSPHLDSRAPCCPVRRKHARLCAVLAHGAPHITGDRRAREWSRALPAASRSTPASAGRERMDPKGRKMSPMKANKSLTDGLMS
jgi:hypothetical protein